MPGVATALLADVWAALDACLPGHRRVEKLHHWWIYPPHRGAPYRSSPLGEHGKRRRVRIECGHIKAMAHQFETLDCVLDHIPACNKRKRSGS